MAGQNDDILWESLLRQSMASPVQEDSGSLLAHWDVPRSLFVVVEQVAEVISLINLPRYQPCDEDLGCRPDVDAALE